MKKVKIEIKDGIINKEKFGKIGNKKKILWVLKEVNDPKQEESWSLVEFLRYRSEKDEGLFGNTGWENHTYGRVCEVSWGVLFPNLTFDEIRSLSEEKFSSILDAIAVINVKKTPGLGKTNQVGLEKMVRENPEILEGIIAQINDISPDIIICGNTFYLLEVASSNFNHMIDWRFIDNKNRTWINAYHPSRPYAWKKYFQEILDAIEKQYI